MSAPRTRVAIYVHHEGVGHLHRAMTIARAITLPVTVLSSLDRHLVEAAAPDSVEVVTLPRDHPASGSDPTAGGALHWAPLDPDVLGPRARTVVEHLTRPDVSVLVTDVSVEAAILARLCGVAPIVVRELGVRTDDAHILGYRIASAILAPFPRSLETHETPHWVRDASFYSGFIARPLQRMTREDARAHLGVGRGPLLVVCLGAGDHSFDIDLLRRLPGELEGWTVLLLGPNPVSSVVDTRVRSEGWVPDIGVHLAAADVVAGTAGANLVAEVAAAARPFICIPEDRPFDEQRVRAHGLREMGVAAVRDTWPERGAWAPAVAEALLIGGEPIGALAAPGSARATADWISQMALAGTGR